jgi:dTDP-glucose pyrophosphorylase
LKYSSLEKVFLYPNNTLRDSISTINSGSLQVALIVDSNLRIIGIITDGDVRRAILKGLSLDCSVELVMTQSPIYVLSGSSQSFALNLMRQKSIHHVPVVDKNMKIIDLFVLDDLINKPSFPNQIILMAGGKGERLKPLTNNCPKPMLTVNGKPILEIILERCINAGFSSFYISVNYLKDHIIDYFGDGCKWGVSIDYLEEESPLGTCGCLKLLPDHINHDLLILNGDIITDLDLDRLIRFHKKSESKMTICSRSHRVRIPFAVLKSSEHYLSSFVEKPMYDYQVNAGVYALNPKCIESMPAIFYNMTDLMEQLIRENQKIGVFPIHENWKDIGNPIDFKEAVDSFDL